MVSTCLHCGERIREEMQFCPRCGAAVGVSALSRTPRIRDQDRRASELLDRMSVGVILVIIAVAYMRNPFEPSTFVEYVQAMSDQDTFIKPPMVFFNLAIFFFDALGVWNLVLSGLRIVLQHDVRKALYDLAGGLFAFFTAFIFGKYAIALLSERATLGYFIAGIGVLIVVRVLGSLAKSEKR